MSAIYILSDNGKLSKKDETIVFSQPDGVIVNCCGLKKSVFFIRQFSFLHRPQKLYFWRQVQVV